MIALLPYDMVGVSAGLSVGLLVGAGYALARISRILGIRAGSIVHELWPPAVSAMLMAAVMLPVDRLLVNPTAHGTVVALLLLAVEGLVALALYTGALVVTAPESVSQLRSLATSALRREGPAASARSGRRVGSAYRERAGLQRDHLGPQRTGADRLSDRIGAEADPRGLGTDRRRRGEGCDGRAGGGDRRPRCADPPHLQGGQRGSGSGAQHRDRTFQGLIRELAGCR